MSKKALNSTSATANLSLKGNDKNTTADFLVVGIGASAGGLETFKEFFDAMPDAPGMAFVLVQHLDPTHKSMLTDLLKPHTSLKVKEVNDGTAVEPNHIYIIPPNKDMAIYNGILHLMDPHEARGFRKPIDFFLRSLAADLKERAVGIIFSGTGTEGTLSLKAIKGAGGLTLVQDPDTAKYDGMPRSAVAAGAADFVLQVNEMPERLIQYASNRKHKAEDAPAIQTQEPNLLEKVFILLRYESGCNFNDYKSSTVIRRIEKRMAINQIERLEDYVKLLQKHPEETVKLFKELLIGVTNFFRDKESFESLESTAIPQIIQQKKEGETIRVWVPGCSTGEEAYSIAMALNDALRKQKKNLHVQIFASDIDADAISSARLGVYPETIVADVSPERLRQYFYAQSHVFRIKKEIRDQIIFAEQNILKDPPFSKLDLASCRNLLIYLNPQAQSRVFSILHYALNPNGILFLGNSESLGEFADMFTTLDQKNKLFVRKNILLEKKPEPGFRVQEVPAPHHARVATSQIKMQKENLASITEKLLLVKYAPACVIVDAKGDAVYFSGNTGKYLQPSPGEARWGLLDMAREGLKADLRTAIAKVRKTKIQEVKKNIKVKTNGHFQVIDLIVRPLSQFEPEEDFLMITFEDREVVEETPAKGKKLPAVELSEINALEQELASTKEYLRSTIEALEISNEELKSTNEELQSANEELQSTNEELETSKEELQSVNEEMVTVNSELQGKIDELAQTNNDMNNLLASTDIGTVFLDSNLNIKRFTPSVTNVINLIPTDVGRPVTHLASNLLYDDLKQDVQKVLDNLVPVRTPVQTRDGIWYQMSIRPYRTSDNVIDGVVLTFVDITELKLMESKLEFSNEHLNLIMKSLPAVPYVCRMSDKFDPIYVGESVTDMLGFNADMFTQKSGFWADRIHPDDKAAVFNLLKEVLKSGKGNQEFRWKCADGSYKRLVNYVRKVKSENGKMEHMVGIWQDIAAQWKSDEMKQL